MSYLHFRSLPGLAFEASKLTTKMDLSLPKDMEQVEFFEKGLRGGFIKLHLFHILRQRQIHFSFQF